MGQVEQDVVLVGPAAPPLAELEEDRPRHQVAGRQILDGRGVALHEALPFAVEQDPPLAARALGQQHPDPVEPGRVELVELRILDRETAPVDHREQVAGQGVGVGGHLEHPPVAAAGDHRRLGVEAVQLPGGQFVGHHAPALTPCEDQV